MNRNEYRRALIMLRSLKAGVSGYVRLERRTLMGTLQFTVNGVTTGGDLYAVLLYRNNGGYSGVRLDKLAAPRYGQTGLVWKFDPRNIENRTLEQYDLAAVIEIRGGVCELLLCGNLNGSVEADWNLVREAACRLFSPVRISGTLISPIDEKKPADPLQDNGIQTLPEYSEEAPAYPGDSDTSSDGSGPQETDHSTAEETGSSEETENTASCSCAVSGEAEGADADNFDLPAQDAIFVPSQSAPSFEPDEFDAPARDETLSVPAKFSQNPVPEDENAGRVEGDELDMPAQDDFLPDITAGKQLDLTNPDAVWPAAIEPLRPLFFSSDAVYPFEMENYVFIQAPLSGESATDSCFVGVSCRDGRPSHVCYAIPAPYTPEPPVGLEGYVWRGNQMHGYWVISEEVAD